MLCCSPAVIMLFLSLSLSWCRLREGSQGGRGLVSVSDRVEHKLCDLPGQDHNVSHSPVGLHEVLVQYSY